MRTIFLQVVMAFMLSVPFYAQQSKSEPVRPKDVSEGVTENCSRDAVVIDGVPSYLWYRGCGPTALGMLVGYYDIHGFPDLFDGDASTQTGSVNDAIANDAHYNDYALPLDYYPNLKQDKSELGGAHTSNCIADFLETSWSSKSNYWGWSWAYKLDDAFTAYVAMRNNEYQTQGNFEFFSPSTSWDIYTEEIDNNRPVVILVDSNGDGSSDHFVTGIGYDETNGMYAIYDTWDHNIHWYVWREMSSSYAWGIYGFSMLKIQFHITAVANPSSGGSVSGTGNFDYGQAVSLLAEEETGYEFVNWTENGAVVSTEANYSFTATENRNLVANFDISSAGVHNLITGNYAAVYPNPVRETLHFNFLNNGIKKITITGISGKLIFEKTEVQQEEIIDVSGFANGVYIIGIQMNNGFLVSKIVKD